MSESGSAVGINGLMRSVGTSVASVVMVALLTSSTEDFAGFTVPTESAFQLCFVVGAVAAFIGVAITAFVPAPLKMSPSVAGPSPSSPSPNVGTKESPSGTAKESSAAAKEARDDEVSVG